MPKKVKDKDDKRVIPSDYEDLSTQTVEVFQKDDNLWYWVVRDDKGNVVKEWTRGLETEAAAHEIADRTFADIGTKTTNRTKKFQTRPQ